VTGERPDGYEQAIGADTVAVVLRAPAFDRAAATARAETAQALARAIGGLVIELAEGQTLDALDAECMREAGWVRRDALVPHVAQAAAAFWSERDRDALGDAIGSMMEVLGVDPPGVDTMADVPGRYCLYAWAAWEAGGGNRDLVGTYRDVPAAQAALDDEENVHEAEVIDRWTMRVVSTYSRDVGATEGTWSDDYWNGTEMVPVETETATVPRPTCALCSERPVEVEMEGRVLACRPCAEDPTTAEHAAEDWR
jgi:hypothetical protein